MENRRVEEKRFSKCFGRNTVITAENVKDIGEIIAVSATKKVMAFTGRALDDLYAGLVHDVFDCKPVDEPYSDGYDLACEAVTYLCGHIGESLDKMIKTDKK
ncbi:MAG: hypothetical protein PHW00_03740 [Clostridia bacterium]|nr:hypothetical protein [Clostridia bacterium]